MRRKYLGAELGGPKVPKVAAAFLLVSLWIGFVTLASWRVLRCADVVEGEWCNASMFEQGAVCGGVFFALVFISIPTLISTKWYSKQAKIDAKAHLESKKWAAFMETSSEIQQNSELSWGPNDQEKGDVNTAGKAMDAQEKRLREAAENEEDAPAFDEIFTPRSQGGAKAFHSDVNFMKCHASQVDTSTYGCHKVSMLPSHHAKRSAVASVVILAYHGSGRNEVVYQTKASMPLGKVMRSWCKEKKMDEAKAIFTYKGKPVSASATISSLGHDLAKGPMKLRAKPTAASLAKTTPAEKINPAEKIEVDV